MRCLSFREGFSRVTGMQQQCWLCRDMSPAFKLPFYTSHEVVRYYPPQSKTT